jgi:hypothetical protein
MDVMRITKLNQIFGLLALTTALCTDLALAQAATKPAKGRRRFS